MNHKLPKNLEPTRDLLAGSLQLHASEQAPALPGDLLDDLASRFSTTPATAAPVRQRSWLAKVQSFIARPAFGMAALALVILGISVPRMIDSTRPTGGFRGSISPTAEAHNIRIILIQSPAGFQQALANVGDFESSMISSATSSDSITIGRLGFFTGDLQTTFQGFGAIFGSAHQCGFRLQRHRCIGLDLVDGDLIDGQLFGAPYLALVICPQVIAPCQSRQDRSHGHGTQHDRRQ